MDGQIPLPLQQHPHFANALRASGCDVREVALAGSAPVQVIARYGLRFASRGPIWEDATGLDRAAALRRSGVHIINSDGADTAALRLAGFRKIHTAPHVAEMCLKGDASARMARMKSKWRNTLRRARSAPFRIKASRFSAKKHAWLLELDLAQQRAKGFRTLPHAMLLAYSDARAADTLVLEACAAEGPIAAMVFLIHGSVATYHLGWTGSVGRAFAAHTALLARAGDDLAARGVMRLDLGTVDTVTAPGLARFKIGSGARVRPLGGTWVRLPLL